MSNPGSIAITGLTKGMNSEGKAKISISLKVTPELGEQMRYNMFQNGNLGAVSKPIEAVAKLIENAVYNNKTAILSGDSSYTITDSPLQYKPTASGYNVNNVEILKISKPVTSTRGGNRRKSVRKSVKRRSSRSQRRK